MSVLRLLLLLLGCLAVQEGLARLLPAVADYVDLMLAPVVWCGIARSQRSAMLAGCAAGLLQDAWFRVGVFGLAGFKKTLLGWILGGLGSRFDLNLGLGRFAAGASLCLADGLLEIPLLRLVQQDPGPLAAGTLLLRSLATGLTIALLFPLFGRIAGRGNARSRTG